jgi:hypothetical protein
MLLNMQEMLGDQLQYRHFAKSFKLIKKALENKKNSTRLEIFSYELSENAFLLLERKCFTLPTIHMKTFLQKI